MTKAKTAKVNEADERRVLLVEDEPALSDIYATALRAGGFAVLQARDGVEGLDQALHQAPDAIVLDLLMPIKDGFETLKDLKLHGETAQIPVIILSNLGQDFEKRRGIDLGAACFLTKTALKPSDLGQVVNSVLSDEGCQPPEGIN
jgi:DNA-binding response OmpR family regulator